MKKAIVVHVLVGTMVGFLCASSSQALLVPVTVNKCLSGKIKAEGKSAAGKLGCHSKGAAGNFATDGICLGKASTKMTTTFGKLDAKGGCVMTSDAPPRDTDTANYTTSVDGAVGHVGKCDGAKIKIVGKFVAAFAGCYSKAAGKDGGIDLNCVSKSSSKFSAAIAKAEAKPPCSHTGQAATLENAARFYVESQMCALDPSIPACALPTATPTTTPTPTVSPTPTLSATPTLTPTATPNPADCGNGSNDFAEPCDETAPSAGWGTCGPDFTCVSCNCGCPTKIHFVEDASDPATVIDSGWTGIAHRAPAVTNADVTVAVSCGSSVRACGVCTISGPIANTGNELRNQRCTNDTSIRCTDDTPCMGGGGTCEFYLGAPLPLAAGGVGTCVENVFNGAIGGTVDIENGIAGTSAFLIARVHAAAISTDTPCPKCVGDPVLNDNVQGGTCTGGPRNGLLCDGNATVPGRPDFATTSFDCPPPASTIGVLPIDLSSTTGDTGKAVTASSPSCTSPSFPGQKCLCDTCNNGNNIPCDSNADCPISGGNPGICGGRRCIGGINSGAPCTANSMCPGGGTCARPGEPTKPNGCVDDSTNPVDGSKCVDTAPFGDHEGECPEGPPIGTCAASSGHPQRSCTTDNECCNDAPACVSDPPTPGECLTSNRRCFLGTGLEGSVDASGMPSPPTQDVATPTLAAVFCVAPTSAPAVNIVAGIPGPGRTTLKGTATGHP